MHETDRLRLLADLAHEHCELNHGPGTRPEDFSASDYLVLPVGYPENDLCETTVREMVVPVCHECATALLGEEWTLLVLQQPVGLPGFGQKPLPPSHPLAQGLPAVHQSVRRTLF